MDNTRFDALTRSLRDLHSRRATLGLVAVGGLSWLGLDDTDAKKKHKKKKKCGKDGGKPVKGTCCAGTVRVNSRCRACDVCSSGCQFSSVQAAITAATVGATITICPGTYDGNVRIPMDLRLVGASADSTVIQGTGMDAAVRVEGSAAGLEHLRVTGGASPYSGIFNLGTSTLTLRNATVSGNSGDLAGGIYNSSTLHLIASEVSGNEGNAAGGIYNYPGSTVIADSSTQVTRNTARTAGGGGGIFNSPGSTVTLTSNAIVTGNMPVNCAGAAVTNCID